MKTNHLLRLPFLILMLLPVAIFAQGKQDKKDRIETMHIAYLSEKLNLSSPEAEKFWPIYNEYKSAQDKLRKERMENIQSAKRAGGVDSMNDADAQKLIAAETDFETHQLELRKEYITKFQQAISIRKVAKFFIAEDEFKRYLLNELKHRDHEDRDRDNDEHRPN
jgi:hypothetical protein